MGILTNKISRFVYDRGLVSFSLENENPGPNGSVQVEQIINLTIRYDDYIKMVHFLDEQATNIVHVDDAWKSSLLKTKFDHTNINEQKQYRPEIGLRVGP